MQGRPSSSRPSTSARPTTAFDRDQFQHHQQRLQQQQPYEIEEEYEEESDDEDVFAFLPPSTADQETSQSPFAHYVQYPEPAFDPWGRQYPTPAPASSFSSNAPPVSPPPHAPPSPPGISPTHSHPHPYPYNRPSLPPPSPSTDSHPSTGMSGPDLYRLKRIGTAVSSKLGAVEDVKKLEKVPEPDRDDTRNQDEKKADGGGQHPGDDKPFINDTVPSSGRPHITTSQNLQHPYLPTNTHDADTERDAGLHRRSISATIASSSKVLGGGRGTISSNPNTLPYKMYGQHASSYYGRDVRSPSAVAGMHTSIISVAYPNSLSQPLKTPDPDLYPQALIPRLSNIVLVLPIRISIPSHNLNPTTHTIMSNRESHPLPVP